MVERDTSEVGEPEVGPFRPARRVASVLARVVVSVAGGAWVARHAPLGEAWAAAGHISAWAVLVGGCSLVVAYALGALRWRVLLGARASSVPPLGRLLALQAIGAFFAVLLPGMIGGDVVRGIATGPLFARRRDAFLVVALERGAALAGLLVAAGALGLATRAPVPAAVGAAVVVAASVRARRVAPWALAVTLSMGAQVATALCALALVLDVDPRAPPVAALAALVLAQLASLVPGLFSLGPGQVAAVLLLEPLGVAPGDALAASLVYWAIGLVYPVLGGVAYLASGLSLTSARG